MSVTVSTFIEDCKRDLSGQRHIYPRHMAMYKNMVFAQDEVSAGFSSLFVNHLNAKDVYIRPR